MTKYFSSILFRTTNLVSKKMIYEETFVSVLAINEIDAKMKIETYGKSCETKYTNERGEELHLEFIKMGVVGEFLYQSEVNQEVNEIFVRSFETFDEYFKFLM